MFKLVKIKIEIKFELQMKLWFNQLTDKYIYKVAFSPSPRHNWKKYLTQNYVHKFTINLWSSNKKCNKNQTQHFSLPKATLPNPSQLPAVSLQDIKTQIITVIVIIFMFKDVKLDRMSSVLATRTSQKLQAHDAHRAHSHNWYH